VNQWESEKIVATTAQLPLAQEDQARADFYALIARLLLAVPNPDLLVDLAGADSLASQQTDNPLDLAWEKLILTANVMDADAVQEEFDTLFISIGTPRVNPNASVYLAGFMMEKPLANLRTDLEQLGLTRAPGVCELEDHMGALCECMRILITGEQGAKRQSLHSQKLFFGTYIAPWYIQCMDDIRSASGANFYQKVADFAQAFFDIESQAFEIEEGCPSE
jgi:TorA maturation chaperone TorD